MAEKKYNRKWQSDINIFHFNTLSGQAGTLKVNISFWIQANIGTQIGKKIISWLIQQAGGISITFYPRKIRFDDVTKHPESICRRQFDSVLNFKWQKSVRFESDNKNFISIKRQCQNPIKIDKFFILVTIFIKFGLILKALD